jgi:hypothetical protein
MQPFHHDLGGAVGDDSAVAAAGGIVPSYWKKGHDLVYTTQTKSGNYTLATDGNGVITDDVIRYSGTANLTVPAATGSGKSCIVIMDAGTVAITFVHSGSDTIGNGTGFVSRTPGDIVCLIDEAAGIWGLVYSSATERLEGCQSTATAGSTTALTNESKYTQIFTGTSVQTITLPAVTSFPLGWGFQIINLSTGQITIQSSGANNIIVLSPNDSVVLTCVLATGTTAASWSYQTRVPWLVASLAADFTTNTSTALNAITGLDFAIGNNEKWGFEYDLQTGSSAATGSSYGIQVSAGSATVSASVVGNSTSQTAMRVDRITAVNTTTAGTTYGGANVSTNFVRIAGTITAGAADACTVSVAVRPRGALTHTTYTGSLRRAWRITPAP